MTPDDLLQVAQYIAGDSKTGRAKHAFRRRSISTSYYALFHALCRLCADEFATGREPASDIWTRVYRALDHRAARDELNRLSQATAYRRNVDLQLLAQNFAQLQQERHDADYDPHKRYSVADAERCADQAKSAIRSLARLSPADRANIVISLLIRKR